MNVNVVINVIDTALLLDVCSYLHAFTVLRSLIQCAVSRHVCIPVGNQRASTQ